MVGNGLAMCSMKWISVEEDLPKSYTKVLVAFVPHNPDMGGKKKYAVQERYGLDAIRNLERVGRSIKDIDLNGFRTIYGDVTHWMIIPEAPKGG